MENLLNNLTFDVNSLMANPEFNWDCIEGLDQCHRDINDAQAHIATSIGNNLKSVGGTLSTIQHDMTTPLSSALAEVGAELGGLSSEIRNDLAAQTAAITSTIDDLCGKRDAYIKYVPSNPQRLDPVVYLVDGSNDPLTSFGPFNYVMLATYLEWKDILPPVNSLTVVANNHDDWQAKMEQWHKARCEAIFASPIPQIPEPTEPEPEEPTPEPTPEPPTTPTKPEVGECSFVAVIKGLGDITFPDPLSIVMTKNYSDWEKSQWNGAFMFPSGYGVTAAATCRKEGFELAIDARTPGWGASNAIFKTAVKDPSQPFTVNVDSTLTDYSYDWKPFATHPVNLNVDMVPGCCFAPVEVGPPVVKQPPLEWPEPQPPLDANCCIDYRPHIETCCTALVDAFNRIAAALEAMAPVKEDEGDVNVDVDADPTDCQEINVDAYRTTMCAETDMARYIRREKIPTDGSLPPTLGEFMDQLKQEIING